MRTIGETSRRAFLASLGLGSVRLAAAEASERPTAPRDMPRSLRPTGADLGSLFPEVEKLAGPQAYRDSFLGGRFRTPEEFRRAAREKVLELLQYRPEKVDPKPELLERTDRGDHVREKVLFSTAPACRVPAYVLLPKNLKRPAPAIVDLHSHGGMFLFGKEKVIDLGDNHPAMTAYHKSNYDG